MPQSLVMRDCGLLLKNLNTCFYDTILIESMVEFMYHRNRKQFDKGIETHCVVKTVFASINMEARLKNQRFFNREFVLTLKFAG